MTVFYAISSYAFGVICGFFAILARDARNHRLAQDRINKATDLIRDKAIREEIEASFH